PGRAGAACAECSPSRSCPSSSSGAGSFSRASGGSRKRGRRSARSAPSASRATSTRCSCTSTGPSPNRSVRASRSGTRDFSWELSRAGSRRDEPHGTGGALLRRRVRHGGDRCPRLERDRRPVCGDVLRVHPVGLGTRRGDVRARAPGRESGARCVDRDRLHPVRRAPNAGEPSVRSPPARAVGRAAGAAAVCALVMPHRTSVGGDMFALTYNAESREIAVYNGSGAAPHRLDPDAFATGCPARGAAVATVPGLLAGIADLVADQGRLGLDRALAPAAGYAESGFPVSDVLAGACVQEGGRLTHDDEASQLFGPRGRWARAGEMLQQPDLALTLRAVARDGADAFYRGDLGERFATAIASTGGVIDRADLSAHRTDRPEPLAIEYRGLRVFGQPPVSQGHILLEELAIVGEVDIRALEWGS